MNTNTFDESKVRREQGKFAEKPHSEADVDLGSPMPKPTPTEYVQAAAQSVRRPDLETMDYEATKGAFEDPDVYQVNADFEPVEEDRHNPGAMYLDQVVINRHGAESEFVGKDDEKYDEFASNFYFPTLGQDRSISVSRAEHERRKEALANLDVIRARGQVQAAAHVLGRNMGLDDDRTVIQVAVAADEEAICNAVTGHNPDAAAVEVSADWDEDGRCITDIRFKDADGRDLETIDITDPLYEEIHENSYNVMNDGQATYRLDLGPVRRRQEGRDSEKVAYWAEMLDDRARHLAQTWSAATA